jgi:hypothetical protein
MDACIIRSVEAFVPKKKRVGDVRHEALREPIAGKGQIGP